MDAKANMGGHDVKAKVGTITAATIEGNAIHIEGFLYAADFPKEVRRIQSERNDLGFSWEIQNIFVEDTTADPLVITGCIFTGAAILYKDKAAYTTTSLAAQAEENYMSKEILEAINATGRNSNRRRQRRNRNHSRGHRHRPTRQDRSIARPKTPPPCRPARSTWPKLNPMPPPSKAVAAAMEKDGIGGHGRMGHVRHAGHGRPSACRSRHRQAR